MNTAASTTGIVIRSIGLPADDIQLFGITGSSASTSNAYSGVSSVEYDGVLNSVGTDLPLNTVTGNGLILLFGSNDTAIFANIPTIGPANIIGMYIYIIVYLRRIMTNNCMCTIAVTLDKPVNGTNTQSTTATGTYSSLFRGLYQSFTLVNNSNV